VAEIPGHLVDWAVPEEIPTDGFIFQVRLRCPCGGGRLRLLHPGEIHHHPEKEFAYPVGVTVGGQSFFLIRAECVECGRTKLVFDADIHGRTAIGSGSSTKPCSEVAKARPTRRFCGRRGAPRILPLYGITAPRRRRATPLQHTGLPYGGQP
jgi:hypothetical protein